MIAALLVGSTAIAAAQPATKASDAFAEGQRRYAKGEYLIAAARFEAAFALDPDPVYLFNIAQAYRFGNACAKAASSYRKFLAAVPQAPNADKVKTYIEQSDDCANKQAEMLRPAPPPPDPVRIPPLPPERDQAHPGRGKRMVGLGLGVVGIAALGVAGFYAYKVHDYANQREQLCKENLEMGQCVWGHFDREAKEIELDRLGERAERREKIGWIAGGVALAGGIAIYLWGSSSSDEQRPAVSVVPADGGAMAVSAFSF